MSRCDLQKKWRVLCCMVALMLAICSAASANDSVLKIPTGQRQLFLDDQVIAKLDNVIRTMHQPDKRGAVIRSPNPVQSLQTRSAPVWDDESQFLKFWVMGIDDTLWQSRDGLHWGAGPHPDLQTDHVVYDPRDRDPNRRFKAALTSKGFAVSPDGAHWTKLKSAAIPSADEGNLSYDPQEGLFIHAVKRYPKAPAGVQPPRCVGIVVSRDFQTWKDYGIVFQADERDQELGKQRIASRFATPTLEQPVYNDPKVYQVDVYNMGVFYYEGQYIGLPAMYHATAPIPNYPNTEGFHIIELACSRDLKTWRRLGDRRARHVPRDWFGDRDWLPVPINRGDFQRTRRGVHIDVQGGTLRLERLGHNASRLFAGIERNKSVTAQHCQADGSRVFFLAGHEHLFALGILADVRPTGAILQTGVVEPQLIVLHQRRRWWQNLRQIVSSAAEPRWANECSAIRWKSGKLSGRRGESISLRFKLQNASLYSFWFDAK